MVPISLPFYCHLLFLVPDEPESRVHGILTRDGIFEGKVRFGGDTYVIQRSHLFFSQPRFHSVIYKHSHVKMDTLQHSLCNADKIHEKLKHLHRQEANRTSQDNHRSKRSTRHRKNLYSAHNRQRRTIDPTKTTCTLYLQADHLFYQKFHSNEETVIEQLTQHVQGVNDIYKSIGKYALPFTSAGPLFTKKTRDLLE